ncbi:MAG: hypothetical protein JWO06_1959 [Bacteroidota bacterium]|nr:hypothetical protein [Bacteroidota bacterium]
MEDRVQKAISILDLSAKGDRGDTIAGLLQNILYLYNEMLTAEQISEYARDIFDVRLAIDEIHKGLVTLVQNNRVSARAGKFVLADGCYTETRARESAISEFVKENKSAFLLATADSQVEPEEAEAYWTLFNAYLYQCIFRYGSGALRPVISEIKHSDFFYGIELLKIISVRISNDEKRKLFVSCCLSYLRHLNTQVLNYYVELAESMISFYSLNYPGLWEKPVQWVVFADTNFLAELLGLESGPVSMELFKVIKENNLNIRFKFLPITLVELFEQKAFFEKLVPTNTLNNSVATTILQSDYLDADARKWYEGFITEPKAPQPLEIINSAEKILVENMGFEKYDYRFERVFKEEYITERISEYQKYLNAANATRQANDFKTLSRNGEQLQHDVFLRAAIGQLKAENYNLPALYFGVTGNEALVNYDKQQTYGEEMQRFFSPAFLLSTLMRLYPVESDTATPVLAKAVFNIHDPSVLENPFRVQDFVSFYLQKGLSDEKLLLGFISDEDFLAAFSAKSESERERFFEMELSSRASNVDIKAGLLMKQLNDVVLELAKTKQDASLNETKVLQQESEIRILKEKQLRFENELQRLWEEQEKETVSKIETQQPTPAAIVEEPEVKEQHLSFVRTWDTVPDSSKEEPKPKPFFARAGILALCLFLGVFALGSGIYFYFSKTINQKVIGAAGINAVSNTSTPGSSQGLASDTTKIENVTGDISTTLPHDEVKANTTSTSPAEPIASDAPKKAFSISEARVKSDLVGMKLSGCDIVIKSPAEIMEVGNLTLVQKLSTGSFKYKFTAKIRQGATTYSATPYIYYNSGGNFIKIDGTNCE